LTLNDDQFFDGIVSWFQFRSVSFVDIQIGVILVVYNLK
jgi:hypothetical protein